MPLRRWNLRTAVPLRTRCRSNALMLENRSSQTLLAADDQLRARLLAERHAVAARRLIAVAIAVPENRACRRVRSGRFEPWESLAPQRSTFTASCAQPGSTHFSGHRSSGLLLIHSAHLTRIASAIPVCGSTSVCQVARTAQYQDERKCAAELVRWKRSQWMRS